MTISPSSSNEPRTHRALLSTMRHELRTPINAIIGYSEMLLEDAEGDADAEAFARDLRKIHSAGEQLLTRVNTILDPERVDLAGANLEALGVALRHDLRTPVSAIIGDAELLIEDTGGDASGGCSEVRADLEKIRLAATRFLALIDDVVMFGITDNELATAAGPNAVAALAEETVRTIPGFESGSTPPRHGGRHPILVVDDNAINREMLSRRLERQGYRVAVAVNGHQALAMARVQPFDLMLLDMMMPEMNGYEVLQVWMVDETLKDIPVIVVSALDEVDSVARCVELGAADYLTKPFNPILLNARIEACLEKKWLRDQEIEYLRNVALVTEAASMLERGAFDPHSLVTVAVRDDGLGQLARVFQQMAHEVATREQRLRQEVQALRIEVNGTKRARAVADITGTEYFQQLQQRAALLRKRGSDRP